MEVIMRTKTTLLAIFVIVTAIALVTAGSITASTLAVKKKSTVTTKKSTGSKKIKSSKASTGGGTTTTAAAGTGNSILGRTEHFSKFIICMRLLSGPLTRPNVDIVIILHMAPVVLVASSDPFLMPAQYLVPYQKPVILDHLLVVAVQLLELFNDN
jgi:hypothetical protein